MSRRFERRGDARSRVVFTGLVRRGDKRSPALLRVVDLSPGGARCRTRTPLRLGATFHAEFFLEGKCAAGNPRVILCERGIRTFETSTRNTLDLCSVPVLMERPHLPVIVDPSHAAGRREFVPPLARAAIAVGADGLIMEVHPEPEAALSDGRQSMTLPAFEAMMSELRQVAHAVGRSMGGAPKAAAH